MVQLSGAASAAEGDKRQARGRYDRNRRPSAATPTPSNARSNTTEAGEKPNRARSIADIGLKVTEILTSKVEGQQVPTTVRGTDLRTGETRLVTLMTPQKAAELIASHPKDNMSFEDRVSKFATSFAKRKGVGELKVGDEVFFQRTYEIEGQKTLHARWPHVARSADAPHQLAHAGLVHVRDIGAGRGFIISSYDDKNIMPLSREKGIFDQSAVEMFGALEADGVLADRRLLVAVERAGEAPTVYTLGFVAQKNEEGKYVVPARDRAVEIYGIEPETNRASAPPTIEQAGKMMSVMVFEQEHDRHTAMAAAAIIGAMSSKPLEVAFESMKFRSDVSEQDRQRAFDLMTATRSGEARAGMMQGAQYQVWRSVKERLADSSKSLVGSGWYPGFVAAESVHTDGRQMERALVSFVSSTTTKPSWQSAQVLGQNMLDHLDAKLPAFAATKPLAKEEAISMEADPSPF